MTPNKLSIIIPFAEEHPQAAFTVQAIYTELRDFCDFEIIVIDNHCEELETQLERRGLSLDLEKRNLPAGLSEPSRRDHGGRYLQSLADGKHRPWLKYVAYDEKLSHWNAKNLGVAASSGEFLWFCDSHCIPSQGSLRDMFACYKKNWQTLNGTLHMPLAYMLERPGQELIYKLVTDVEKAVVHYSFTRYRAEKDVYQVPCMSTCGMMMHRSIYDELGGWPTELGIYGGGEHFINFTLATLGKTINIFPAKPLFHYAAPRGYHWNYNDYHRNRCIATYMYGGPEWAYRYIMNIKGNDPVKESIFQTVVGSEKCRAHYKLLEGRRVKTISHWLKEQAVTLPDDMIEPFKED